MLIVSPHGTDVLVCCDRFDATEVVLKYVSNKVYCMTHSNDPEEFINGRAAQLTSDPGLYGMEAFKKVSEIVVATNEACDDAKAIIVDLEAMLEAKQLPVIVDLLTNARVNLSVSVHDRLMAMYSEIIIEAVVKNCKIVELFGKLEAAYHHGWAKNVASISKGFATDALNIKKIKDMVASGNGGGDVTGSDIEDLESITARLDTFSKKRDGMYLTEYQLHRSYVCDIFKVDESAFDKAVEVIL